VLEGNFLVRFEGLRGKEKRISLFGLQRQGKEKEVGLWGLVAERKREGQADLSIH
jgi:hypothetical protein